MEGGGAGGASAASSEPLPPPPSSSCNGPSMTPTPSVAQQPPPVPPTRPPPSLHRREASDADSVVSLGSLAGLDCEQTEALILQDIKTLACRISVGAILRPKAEELLAGLLDREHGYRKALAGLSSGSEGALAKVQELRLRLLTPTPDEEAGEAAVTPPPPAAAASPRLQQETEEDGTLVEKGAGDCCHEHGTDPLEAVDGCLEALKAQAEVQRGQLAAIEEELAREVDERRALVARMSQRQSSSSLSASVDDEWALLAERLRQLGVHRLAAAFRAMAGRSRSGSQASLGSLASAQPTPAHSRSSSYASLPPVFSAAGPTGTMGEEQEGEYGLSLSEGQQQHEDREAGEEEEGEATWAAERGGAIEAMRQQIETQAARADGLRRAIAEEQAAQVSEMEKAHALAQSVPRVGMELVRLLGRLKLYGASRMAALLHRAQRLALERAWARWRTQAVAGRVPSSIRRRHQSQQQQQQQEEGGCDECLPPPPPLPAHAPSATLLAMEEGAETAAAAATTTTTEKGDGGPPSPPPLPAHAPSATLVAMEEGGQEDGAGAATSAAPAGETGAAVAAAATDGSPSPWAQLGLPLDAQEELEALAQQLEDRQRQIAVLEARVAGEARERQAVLGAATSQQQQHQVPPTTVVQTFVLPAHGYGDAAGQGQDPQHRAVLSLMAKARALASAAIGELFRELQQDLATTAQDGDVAVAVVQPPATIAEEEEDNDDGDGQQQRRQQQQQQPEEEAPVTAAAGEEAAASPPRLGEQEEEGPVAVAVVRVPSATSSVDEEKGLASAAAAAAAAAPALSVGEDEVVAVADGAVPPSSSSAGLASMQAAMADGLYEALREQLTCQMEQVAELECALARCQRLSRDMQRRAEGLGRAADRIRRLQAETFASSATVGGGGGGGGGDGNEPPQQQQKQQQPSSSSPAGVAAEGGNNNVGCDDQAAEARLVALKARLRVFAARAVVEWAEAVQRRRLRGAWRRWSLATLEAAAAGAVDADMSPVLASLSLS